MFILVKELLALLAATPVHNHLGELWAQMSFLMPSVFSDSDGFLETFSSSSNTTSGTECQEEELLITNRLHQVSSVRTSAPTNQTFTSQGTDRAQTMMAMLTSYCVVMTFPCEG